MEKAFVACQESIVNELTDMRINLIAGRYEYVYNKMNDLIDELTTDILISKKEPISDVENQD